MRTPLSLVVALATASFAGLTAAPLYQCSAQSDHSQYISTFLLDAGQTLHVRLSTGVFVDLAQTQVIDYWGTFSIDEKGLKVRVEKAAASLDAASLGGQLKLPESTFTVHCATVEPPYVFRNSDGVLFTDDGVSSYFDAYVDRWEGADSEPVCFAGKTEAATKALRLRGLTDYPSYNPRRAAVEACVDGTEPLAECLSAQAVQGDIQAETTVTRWVAGTDRVLAERVVKSCLDYVSGTYPGDDSYCTRWSEWTSLQADSLPRCH